MAENRSENVCLFYHGLNKRTVIYRGFYDYDTVFVEQRKGENEWMTVSHMMLPNSVLDCAVAFKSASPRTYFPEFDDPDGLAKEYVDHTLLPEDLRILLYKYDYKTAPFCENQLGIGEQIEDLLAHWKLETTWFSPQSPLPSDQSESFVPLDEKVATTPVKSKAESNIFTPTTQLVAESDDSPLPEQCLAPKKRKLNHQRTTSCLPRCQNCKKQNSSISGMQGNYHDLMCCCALL